MEIKMFIFGYYLLQIRERDKLGARGKDMNFKVMFVNFWITETNHNVFYGARDIFIVLLMT